MKIVALLGAAHIHTPNFVKRLQARPGLQVRYVWDHDAPRAEKNAAELKARVAPDLPTVLADPEVGAVIVCSETIRHEEIAVAAATAGKHLFVEKPLGFAAADARRIAQAVEKAGVLFQTGYFMRGDPKMLFLRRLVQNGSFGHLCRARASTCHQGALAGWFDTEWRWMADPAQAGCGAFGDLGTHSLDLLLWLFGRVEAATGLINPVIHRYPGCDETGEGLLLFAGGLNATLAAGWTEVGNPLTFLVSGSDGYGAIFNGALHVKCDKLGLNGEVSADRLPMAMPHAFDLFLDAISEPAPQPLIPARECFARNAVMEAIQKGAAERRWVTPEEF